LLNAWKRAEHYRDLAEECRRLATSTRSSQMKNRYLLMARDDTLLADVAEQVYPSCTGRALPKMARTPEPLA
jgi:hypothetical protein